MIVYQINPFSIDKVKVIPWRGTGTPSDEQVYNAIAEFVEDHPMAFLVSDPNSDGNLIITAEVES